MRRGFLLVVTTLVVATIFISPFRRDLFVGDETKYSQVIREMRDSGSYLVPQLNGRPYTHKPPVHFWVITALTYLFGYQSLWPFVLQSILSYIALLFVVRAFARELFSDAAGPPSVFVFATSILAWGIAQTARMDASFTLFISLAALFYARYLRTARSSAVYAGAAMIAIAILIKGPMAFVVVALLVTFHTFAAKKWGGVTAEEGGRGRPRYTMWLAAFLIVLIGPLLWLVPALMRGGRQYAHDLLIKQNVGRALNAWTHKEPFWYYLTHLPATLFPWFFVAVIATIAIFKRAEDVRYRRAAIFCLSWIAAVVVPFSLLSSKLDVYMLPILLPVALIVGHFLASDASDSYARWAILANRIVVAILFAVFALLPLITQRLKPTAELDLMRPAIPTFAMLTAVVIAAGAVLLAGYQRAPLASSISLGVAGIAPLVVATAVLMPQINEISSTRPLVAQLATVNVPAEQMALFACPNLWTRDMPQSLFAVRYVGDDVLETDPHTLPAIVATKRSRAAQLGDALQSYDRIATVRMIGKDFDVYRRR